MGTGAKLVRFFAGGVIMGVLWFLNRSQPAWQEAVRTIIVFSLITTVLYFRLRKKNVVVHVVPLLATRVVLVCLAAIAEQAMRHHAVANSALIVAIALGVIDCTIGAVAHNRFFTYAGPAVTDRPDEVGSPQVGPR